MLRSWLDYAGIYQSPAIEREYRHNDRADFHSPIEPSIFRLGNAVITLQRRLAPC